jgi:hypothetical protein
LTRPQLDAGVRRLHLGTFSCWEKPLRIRRVGLVLLLAATGCGSPITRAIDITALNYAFQAPSSISPGPARLRLINAGTVPHEIQVFVFKPGISADSARALLNTMDRVPNSLSDSSGAVLIAAPHTTAPEEVYVDLQPGRVYALVCQFRDSPKAQRHDRLGMFGVLHVTSKR